MDGVVATAVDVDLDIHRPKVIDELESPLSDDAPMAEDEYEV